MNRTNLLRVFLLGMAFVILGSSSELASAAGGRGGGGFGGGGFHGGGYQGGGYHGGGGGGYHGGGGYRGGGWGGYGYRGGYGWGGYRGGYGYGWRGGWGGWGCCGWGIGLSFNFGWPYYSGWGYPYYSYAPYYSPYYAYPTYPYPYYYAPVSAPQAYAQPAPTTQTSAAYQSDASGQQINNPVPQSPGASQLKFYEANYAARPARAIVNSAADSVATYRSPTNSNSSAVIRTATYTTASRTRDVAQARPEVVNVIRAVRGMPPQAGERALESGRYGNLSPAELQQVRKAAGLPPA